PVPPRDPPSGAPPRFVTLTHTLNARIADVIGEGIDVAIRVGEVTDPGLIARRIGLVRRVTVATPAYLGRRRAPACPGDLADHDCIVYTRLAT
ncbi:LysR substrate-binding domain-containing protein, partial [Acinetobacter baumannii]